MKLLKEKKILQYIAVFILVTFCYIMYRLISPSGTNVIRAEAGTLVSLSGIYVLYRLKKKQLTPEFLISSVIFAGIVMRISYMLCTPCTERAYELLEMDAESGSHAGYILTLIQNKALPQSSYEQFSQQPLFYILGALVSAPLNAFIGNAGAFQLTDAAKIISASASCILLLMVPSVCDELNLKGYYRAAAVTLTAFHPSFFLGERITPDMLAALLMTTAFLYALRWFRKPGWINAVITAVSIGMALMTKLSALTIAVFAAFLFIAKLNDKTDNTKTGTLVSQLLVSAAVSGSLGLWFSIRNHSKFGQAFRIVPDVINNSSYDRSDYSYFSRLILPDMKSFITTPYARVSSDYSIWTYMIKSSLFGEFEFDVYSFIPIVLMIAAITLTIPAVAGIIKGASGFRNPDSSFFTSAAVILFMALNMYLYIKYPLGSTMDFRYMTFMLVPSAVLAGRYCSDGGRKWIKVLYGSSLAVFSVFSCVMYTIGI